MRSPCGGGRRGFYVLLDSSTYISSKVTANTVTRSLCRPAGACCRPWLSSVFLLLPFFPSSCFDAPPACIAALHMKKLVSTSAACRLCARQPRLPTYPPTFLSRTTHPIMFSFTIPGLSNLFCLPALLAFHDCDEVTSPPPPETGKRYWLSVPATLLLFPDQSRTRLGEKVDVPRHIPAGLAFLFFVLCYLSIYLAIYSGCSAGLKLCR